MDYEKKYKVALERANIIYTGKYKPEIAAWTKKSLEAIFPELKESEDEKIKKALMKFIEKFPYERLENDGVSIKEALAWLEKQGSEPNWCHHKVDLSNCSEEYRKAYYDGWNNCNHQHSQCKSESNDVIKCLINGMKFYYEDNEEATWGTEKFSMKVKDILSWLEKQGEQKLAWSEEDEKMVNDTIDCLKKPFPYALEYEQPFKRNIDWLKSLKQRIKGD